MVASRAAPGVVEAEAQGRADMITESSGVLRQNLAGGVPQLPDSNEAINLPEHKKTSLTKVDFLAVGLSSNRLKSLILRDSLGFLKWSG